jgi:polysaccharide chain length determinant protein (PEP-CTERM system associated)
VLLTQMADKFEANARVYVDTKTVLRPLMRDLAVEPDMEAAAPLLARTLITRPNIELLIRKTKLDLEATTPVEHEKLVARLLRDIKLTSLGRDNVFDFSFRDVSPDRARTVVENLVALFLESDTTSKQRDAEAARSFIDEQIKGYEVRLAEAETRLKEFKIRNLGVADPGRDYFQRMSTLTEELNKVTIELKAAEQSQEALKRELAGEVAVLLPETPIVETPTASPELDARLDTQRKQLDELLRRYTDLHPDVVATKRLIARLEEQRAAEIETKRKALAARPPSRAAAGNDPVFQRVKLAVAEAEANVASLRFRFGDTQARLAALRASASRVPQVEAELAQLNRDYDVVRRNYEALVGRREKASISEDIDATRAAQFRVIDPPRAAKSPVFPNRQSLAPLVLIAALIAGMAASFLATQLRPTLDSTAMLRALTNRPVLGSVSMRVTPAGVRRTRLSTFAFVSSLGALVVLCGAWMTWLTSVTRVF